jgi:hypothetical protein
MGAGIDCHVLELNTIDRTCLKLRQDYKDIRRQTSEDNPDGGITKKKLKTYSMNGDTTAMNR